MKRIAITCALLSSFVVSSVWADAASDLKSRLDKVSSFHASFTQKVTDGSGAASHNRRHAACFGRVGGSGSGCGGSVRAVEASAKRWWAVKQAAVGAGAAQAP